MWNGGQRQKPRGVHLGEVRVPLYRKEVVEGGREGGKGGGREGRGEGGLEVLEGGRKAPHFAA